MRQKNRNGAAPRKKRERRIQIFPVCRAVKNARTRVQTKETRTAKSPEVLRSTVLTPCREKRSDERTDKRNKNREKSRSIEEHCPLYCAGVPQSFTEKYA